MEDPAEIAAVCQEYVASLDNVSHEVTHILKEIQHKDAKVQDLLPKIAAREGQLRELLNKGSPGAPASAGGTAAGTSAPNNANGGGPSLPSAPNGATSPTSPTQPGSSGPNVFTDADKQRADRLLDRIKHEYRRVDDFSSQKEALAQRLWRIIHAHTARLQDTFDKVSEPVMNVARSNVAQATGLNPLSSTISSATQGSAILGAIAAAFGAGGPGAVGVGAIGGSGGGVGARLDEPAGMKRKGGLGGMASPAAASGSSSRLVGTPARGRGGASLERTTPGAAGSPGADSPSRGYGSSQATYGSGGSAGRPRKSGLGGNKARGGSVVGNSALSNVFSAFDEGAGGDDDSSLARRGGSAGAFDDGVGGTLGDMGGAAGDEDRDETLYCFCQKISYGEMIGCDSENCRYEWFHLDCVGVHPPLPEQWICSDCLARQAEEEETKKKASKDKAVKKEKKERDGSADPGASRGKKEGSNGPGANKRRKKN
ncbi:hypothetical protein BDZ90DRAFT_257796 [Jaminaea rosea]|uniref:Chromatin modification-related protein n=1 Tax=Jaminaea rosea TaxID=1569628 RepID=A0A316V0H0_9BASI|nr:hypothetical protein BDZ90DRAFT_257796 [Jaminaea rosea]PWN30734.1 hypothetical protein BDZ90DRAFT_257796 [Jaminaea rosea]